MTSKAGRRALRVAALVVGTFVVQGVALSPRVAHAQSADELKQARDLFQEAYKDEQEQRYEEALEKFRRVAQVKESASVRYRIAAVLEAMGRLRESRDAYRAVAAMKPSLPQNQQEISDASAERALQVDKRVPKLVVTVESAPADARVTVDGAPVPQGRPVEQDPGEHVVQATASGMKPFEQRVTLKDDGAEVPATVKFESDKPAPPPEPPPEKKNNTLAFVAIGGGVVLMGAGAAALLLREGAIDDIHSACPDLDRCPRSQQGTVEDATDKANLYMPLGIGLAGLGAVATGVGVYLLVRPAKKPADAAPAAPAASLRLSPQVVRGGATFGLHGTF